MLKKAQSAQRHGSIRTNARLATLWSGHRNCLGAFEADTPRQRESHARNTAGKLDSTSAKRRNRKKQSSQKSDTQQLCQARLRCRFAARGLRGAVAFGSLEKKKQASAASTVRGSPAGEPPRNDTLATATHPGPEGCLGCVAGLRPYLHCWPRTGRAK